MFIRLNTSKRTKNPIVQVLESYREGSKVKQRIVATLGVAKDANDIERMKKVAFDLIAKLDKEAVRRDIFNEPIVRARKPNPTPVDPRNLEHQETVYDGFDQVISALLKDCGLADLNLTKPRAKMDGSSILRLLLSQQWDLPASKLRSFHRQKEHGFSGIQSQQVYRFLDHLLKAEKKILGTAYSAIYGRLGPGQVDCLFVDVTTLYFESVEKDEIRDFGFSKDQKYHNVQTVLCLVVNGEGIPLAYEAFPGNTAEVNTLLPVLEKIKIDFQVESVTIVADRGMASRKNIETIANLGFTWITATKIKHLPAALGLNDLETFSKLAPANDSDEEVLWKVVDHPRYPGSNLLVTYSARRAKKDGRDREAILARLEGKLITEGEVSRRPGKLVSNNGYRRFVTFNEPGQWKLNQEAIAKAAQWDGFHAIAYSKSLKMSVKEILTQYKSLWRIEEAFRVAKSYLEIRPIFHWTKPRIQAHILFCYVGLFLERYLEVRLRNVGTPLTPDRIRAALRATHTVHLTERKTRQSITIPSRLTADAKAIFAALRITTKRTTGVQPIQ